MSMSVHKEIPPSLQRCMNSWNTAGTADLHDEMFKNLVYMYRHSEKKITGCKFLSDAPFLDLQPVYTRQLNGSTTVLLPSVNTHRTVLNRSVPRRTVLPRIGGPQLSRTVPIASINKRVA